MEPTRSLSDEQQLIQRLRRGERAALEQMIVEHRDSVHRLVARLTGWSGETDDLVQDVFVAALRGAKGFRGGSRISTWLTRIAINVCRSHHRSRLVRLSYWKQRLRQAAEIPVEDASEPAEQRERARRVRQAVQRLGNKYREAIVLHYLQEMSSQEIQQTLGLSRIAVEVRLHRARRILQDMLAPMIQQDDR